ncbi:GntR family transcriptional regulator [Actinomadura sp. LOL_016]|uniref:GntR family transcriptional regulator n=1 Tax=unclassified Actinomadura TaxID=2626254 RepID=UPI003A7FC068
MDRTPAPSVKAKQSPYDKIRDAILSGELTGGTQLTESSLATWCGVSRTPIREALLRLEQDGLTTRTERGYTVRSRSPEEILDIYDVRIPLEVTAARSAAMRRTDHDVRAMRQALAHRPEEPATPAELVKANVAFHRRVWRAAHNEAVVDLLQRVDLHLARYPETTLSAPGRWEQACEEHARLVDAIEARDAEAAAAIAQQHFTEARDIKLRLLDDAGTDF